MQSVLARAHVMDPSATVGVSNVTNAEYVTWTKNGVVWNVSCSNDMFVVMRGLEREQARHFEMLSVLEPLEETLLVMDLVRDEMQEELMAKRQIAARKWQVCLHEPFGF